MHREIEKQLLSQCQQNKRDDRGLQETAKGAPSYPHRQDNSGEQWRRWKQRLFNLRRLKKYVSSPKTLTNFYRCTNESILSGCITTWYHRKQPQGAPEGGAVCTIHRWGQTPCPPGHLQHPMSQEGQKDHQRQQPPEPLPVHPAIILKARTVQVHQSRDRETENQLLSQGHQTVKQPPLTLSGCCQYTDLTPATLTLENLCKNVSLATLNNAT